MTAHALVHELPAILSKPSDVEDVAYKAVSDVVLKKVTVVYNHFNLEAILAAAALKQAYSDFDIISVTQLIGKESDMYVWIGIDPEQLIDRDLASGKEHRVYSSHDVQAADEDGIRPGVMEQVCEDFKVRATPQLLRLSFLSAHFYNFDTRVEDLAYVYNEVKNAIALLHGICVKPITLPSEMKAAYMESVKTVKAQFDRRYKTIHAIDSKDVKDTIYTAFTDFNFIIALRLMRMAHANFVNHSYCLNGQLVYSNMKQPKFSASSEKIIMMN